MKQKIKNVLNSLLPVIQFCDIIFWRENHHPKNMLRKHHSNYAIILKYDFGQVGYLQIVTALKNILEKFTYSNLFYEYAFLIVMCVYITQDSACDISVN